MHLLAVISTCLVCVGYPWRVQTSKSDLASDKLAEEQARLAKVLAQSKVHKHIDARSTPDDLARMLLGMASQAPRPAHIRSSSGAVMKQYSGAPEIARTESVGSILEFDDGKHAKPLLGVVKEVAAKTKKTHENVYIVMDAADNSYRVSSKHIHCSFPANRKLLATATPSEKLQGYSEIAKLQPSELGVDVDLLEMAWETLADEGELSIEAIMNEIDPDICETPVGKFRAFKLLSSDIGQIFFKRLHGHDYHHLEFMPKSPEKVQASKEAWCKEDGDSEQEFCSIR